MDLRTLVHQNKVDDWIGLKDSSNNNEKGLLKIRIQFLWSKYNYFQDQITKADKQLAKIQQDMNQLDNYLALLNKPYGIITYGKIIEITDSKILEKGEEAEHYLVGSRDYLAASKIRNNESLAFRLESMFQGAFGSNELNLESDIEWPWVTQMFMYLTVILSIIVMLLARSDFLNLIIAIYIFVLFIVQHRLELIKYMRLFLQVDLATIVYDLVWLVFHYTGYWSGNPNEQAEMSLKSWTYFFSFANFIVKIGLFISVWISLNKTLEANKKAKRNKDIMKNNLKVSQ